MSDFDTEFDEIAHGMFLDTGLQVFDDAVLRSKSDGAEYSPVRIQINRALQEFGGDTVSPQMITTVQIFRDDVPAVRQGDTLTFNGSVFLIDSARLDSSGALDTYTIKPGAK